jgi:hypothetical protein
MSLEIEFNNWKGEILLEAEILIQDLIRVRIRHSHRRAELRRNKWRYDEAREQFAYNYYSGKIKEIQNWRDSFVPSLNMEDYLTIIPPRVILSRPTPRLSTEKLGLQLPDPVQLVRTTFPIANYGEF